MIPSITTRQGAPFQYAVIGLQLGHDKPSTWGRRPVRLPFGWLANNIERLWIRGRPWALEARAGMALAS
jgi:hypothetical protein